MAFVILFVGMPGAVMTGFLALGAPGVGWLVGGIVVAVGLLLWWSGNTEAQAATLLLVGVVAACFAVLALLDGHGAGTFVSLLIAVGAFGTASRIDRTVAGPSGAGRLLRRGSAQACRA